MKLNKLDKNLTVFSDAIGSRCGQVELHFESSNGMSRVGAPKSELAR